MKPFLRWYWFASGFLKKYGKGIMVSAFLGIAAFIFLNRYASNISTTKVTHIGRVGLISTSQLPLDIQNQVSSGLTNILPDGQFELAAASSMEISPDGKTYTFTLIPGLTWSDGTPVTSSEITRTPQDVGTDYPRSDTITYTLQEPYTPFPLIVSQPLLKKDSVGRFIKKTRIVGLKDSNISGIKVSGQYIQQLRLDSPRETKIYHFYSTESEAVIAYKLGQVDRLEKLSKVYLENWPNTVASEVSQPNRYLALFFNTGDQYLQDKSTRQLLSYATPKDERFTRVISPISKASWVYNPQVKPYIYNQDTAANILNKLKEANPNYQPEFTLTTTPAYTQIAQSVVSAWANLGIKTNLKIVAFPDLNDFQILLIGQQIPDDPDQYALWHSTQSTNISKYKSPKIDKLLEDGRKEQDRDKRQEIYQEFQRFLVEDSPAAFLYELKQYDLSRK